MALREQFKELEKDKKNLISQLIKMDELIDENDRLKKQLKRYEKDGGCSPN